MWSFGLRFLLLIALRRHFNFITCILFIEFLFEWKWRLSEANKKSPTSSNRIANHCQCQKCSLTQFVAELFYFFCLRIFFVLPILWIRVMWFIGNLYEFHQSERKTRTQTEYSIHVCLSSAAYDINHWFPLNNNTMICDEN